MARCPTASTTPCCGSCRAVSRGAASGGRVRCLQCQHGWRAAPNHTHPARATAGVKAWLVGKASQGVRSVGSTLKLGAGWVAETAGKVAAGKGAAAGPAASAFGGGPAPGDFSIAAGRPGGVAAGPVGVPHVTESAWEQASGMW